MPRLHERPAVQALFLVVATMVVMLHVTPPFEERALVLPEGCDDFGYLSLARSLDEGALFEAHTRRPFDPALIDHLRKSGRPVLEYTWMIAPHAHHVDDRTFKVINQYPPGTSLVLAALPMRLRRQLFPAACVLLWIGALFAALRLGGRVPAPQATSIACLAALALLAFAPLSSFNGTHSVPPTFGLLIAAGYLMRTRPRWACALIGAASLFRVANVLVALPALWASAPKGFFGRGALAPCNLMGVLKGAACLLLGGFGLYLVYVAILLGNPVAPTYSPIDRQLTPLSAIPGHLQHYFSLAEPWLRAHLVTLGACLAVALLIERRLRWFGVALGAAVINYGFFVTHMVAMQYYPYATALLAFGIALQPLVEKLVAAGRIVRMAPVALALAGLVWMAPGLRLPDLAATTAKFDREASVYRETFGGFDVVWGDQRTGTVEYATSRAAFRYTWGLGPVRDDIMRWLAHNGFSQAVWVDDIPYLKTHGGSPFPVPGLVQERMQSRHLGSYVALRLAK